VVAEVEYETELGAIQRVTVSDNGVWLPMPWRPRQTPLYLAGQHYRLERSLARWPCNLRPPRLSRRTLVVSAICDDLAVTEHGGRKRHPEDALPVYRLALEECRNAFNDLMAQPERFEGTSEPYWGLPQLASQFSASLLGGQPGYSVGFARLERSSLSLAWLFARRTSRCHENSSHRCRQTRSLGGVTLATPKPKP
jgi:hypothetical protein